MSTGIDWRHLLAWACVVVPMAAFCIAVLVGGWINDRREDAAKQRGFDVLAKQDGSEPDR